MLTPVATNRVTLYPSDDLAETVEQYAENNDMTVSGAWQDLARVGLKEVVEADE